MSQIKAKMILFGKFSQKCAKIKKKFKFCSQTSLLQSFKAKNVIFAANFQVFSMFFFNIFAKNTCNAVKRTFLEKNWPI